MLSGPPEVATATTGELSKGPSGAIKVSNSPPARARTPPVWLALRDNQLQPMSRRCLSALSLILPGAFG